MVSSCPVPQEEGNSQRGESQVKGGKESKGKGYHWVCNLKPVIKALSAGGHIALNGAEFLLGARFTWPVQLLLLLSLPAFTFVNSIEMPPLDSLNPN